jgi:hypothetical protein
LLDEERAMRHYRRGGRIHRAGDIVADRPQVQLRRQSRRAPRIRSKQSRKAAGAPSKARVTALRVNAAALARLTQTCGFIHKR